MAQYKVPQDVEAEDKLLGPFTFRQFIYLLVVAGLCGLAVVLFQLFPLLAVIPLPPIILFAALALPLKKDQPMETYLSALVSFYLKPRRRFWIPGQRESTITITAPKTIEAPRKRDISGEEAGEHLSFLARVIDSEGYAIKGSSTTPIREEFIAEANAIDDIYDRSSNFDQLVSEQEAKRRETVKQMKAAIDANRDLSASVQKHTFFNPEIISSTSSIPTIQPLHPSPVDPTRTENPVQTTSEKPPQPAIIELANNPDYSVETIAKEAQRISQRPTPAIKPRRAKPQDKNEVYISLR